MTQQFKSIADARPFLTKAIAHEVRMGKESRTMRDQRYVLPYDPSQEPQARELLRNLTQPGTGDLAALGVSSVVVDLYQMVLDHLDEQDLWEPIVEAEPTVDRDALCLMLQDTVSTNEVLAPAVNAAIEAHPDADVAFVTGIGATYPYVRTHTLITALATPKPVVLVFPGNLGYRPDGQRALNILGTTDTNTGGFYRATNLFDL